MDTDTDNQDLAQTFVANCELSPMHIQAPVY